MAPKLSYRTFLLLYTYVKKRVVMMFKILNMNEDVIFGQFGTYLKIYSNLIFEKDKFWL